MAHAGGETPKISDEKKKADQAAADDVAAIDKAANANQATPKRSPGEQAAEDAETKRQEAIVDAVAKAHDAELSKLGGPEANPGNPGHDPETGEPI